MPAALALIFGYITVILPLVLSVGPLVLLTILSLQLGRGGWWLVAPYALAILYGLFTSAAIAAAAANMGLVAPAARAMLYLNAVKSGAELGVLVFALQLTMAGRRVVTKPSLEAYVP